MTRLTVVSYGGSIYLRPDLLTSTQDASSALRYTSTKTPRTYNKPAPVEKLPSEIGLLILHQIPDRGSMSNLIHASPTYHHLYLATREEIFTKLTIRELISRGFDPFSEHNVIKVLVNQCTYKYYHNTHVFPGDCAIWDAAREIYKQCQHQSQVEGKEKGHIVKSSISACLSLLNIIDSKGWRFDYNAGPKEKSVEVTCSQSSGLQEVYYSDRVKYHIIVLADWQVDMRVLSRLADGMLYHSYFMLHVEESLGEDDGCERSLSLEAVLHDSPGV